MQIEKVPGVNLSPSPSARAYLNDFAKVALAYEYDWSQQESFARRAAFLNDGGFTGDRAALAAALERYNQALGADEAAMQNVRLLAQPTTLVAITGQQAGIFTGPAYSIYKAMTTIRLARQQSERLGVPVVPVFWIAGEDHDWHEVSWVNVPSGDTTYRLALKEHFEQEKRSVALAPAPASLPDLIGEFEQLMPETEFKAELMGRIRQAATGAPALGPDASGGTPSLSDWFGRLMAWLFQGTGLIFLDSADPALRQIEAPFLTRAINAAEQVDAAFVQGIERWERLGYQTTVERHPSSLNLFTYVNGERLPLMGEGDRVWVRGHEEITWSTREILDMAQTHPERFSTNVVLRPVVQGFILPDLVYVGGPGEINYLGLYKDVYQVMGQQMPIFYPREGFTLVEPALARIMEKQNLSFDDVFHHLEERKQELLEREDRLGITRLFEEFRQDFGSRYSQLTGVILQLDQHLNQVIEENRKQIEHQIHRLEEKAKHQHRKNCEVSVRQFERLRAHLTPHGLQERSVSILPYLFKFGPDLVSRLVAEVPLEEKWSHRAIYLGE